MSKILSTLLAFFCLLFSIGALAQQNCGSAFLYFYQQPVGTISTPQTYTHVNGNATPMTIQFITVNAPANTSPPGCQSLTTDYSLGGTCKVGLVLMPGESCTVSITLAPKELGPRNMIITLRTDLGNRDVAVSGMGVASDFTRPTKLVVEYVNPGLNQYIITSAPAEIAALDAGVQPGWVRTGATFNGIDPSASFNGFTVDVYLSPMSRWYAATKTDSTHWYFRCSHGFPIYCGRVEANPYLSSLVVYAEEDPDVFDLMPPSYYEGWCPYATIPLYALYDRVIGHRYTVEPTIRANMIAQGWLAEGYGPGVVACVSK